MKPVFRANLYFLIILVLSIFTPRIISSVINEVKHPILALTVSNIIVFIIPIIIYISITKCNTKRLLMLEKPKARDIYRAILIGILAQPIIKFSHYISNLFYSNKEVFFIDSTKNHSIWFLIIIAGLIPSIVQELTMRGVVLSGYNYKNRNIAAIMTGVMYAMLVLNPSKFLYAFIIGIILALMVRATGSIVIGITTHFVINIIQILVQRMRTANLTTKEIINYIEFSKQLTLSSKIGFLILYGILALIFASIIMRIIRKMEKENLNIYLDDLDTETKIACKKEEIVNLPFIISVLIFIAYLFYNFYMDIS